MTCIPSLFGQAKSALEYIISSRAQIDAFLGNNLLENHYVTRSGAQAAFANGTISLGDEVTIYENGHFAATVTATDPLNPVDAPNIRMKPVDGAMWPEMYRQGSDVDDTASFRAASLAADGRGLGIQFQPKTYRIERYWQSRDILANSLAAGTGDGLPKFTNFNGATFEPSGAAHTVNLTRPVNYAGGAAYTPSVLVMIERNYRTATKGPLQIRCGGARDHGLVVHGTHLQTISDIQVYESTDDGILFFGNQSYGVYRSDISQLWVEDCVGSGVVIYTDSAAFRNSGNTFRQISCFMNGREGVIADRAQVTIESPTLESNGRYGLWADDTRFLKVSGGFMEFNNSGSAIFLGPLARGIKMNSGGRYIGGIDPASPGINNPGNAIFINNETDYLLSDNLRANGMVQANGFYGNMETTITVPPGATITVFTRAQFAPGASFDVIAHRPGTQRFQRGMVTTAGDAGLLEFSQIAQSADGSYSMSDNGTDLLFTNTNPNAQTVVFNAFQIGGL